MACYVINRQFVVHELLDHELTVINLEEGHYYIGRNSAVEIFLALSSPKSVEDLKTQMLAEFEVAEGELEAETKKLIDLWLTNNLIRETEPEANLNEAEDNSKALSPEKKTWTTPEFLAFDDIKDLLLLDPIHDTHLDEQGWPAAGS